MNFSDALKYLKNGDRIRRSGWNGKGMWLFYVEAWNVEDMGGVRFRMAVIGLKSLPWIGMKTADNGFVPWLASQTDLLAEDWESVK